MYLSGLSGNDILILVVYLANTICTRSSDTIYVVTYYIKWVTNSWTDSNKSARACLCAREEEREWESAIKKGEEIEGGPHKHENDFSGTDIVPDVCSRGG